MDSKVKIGTSIGDLELSDAERITFHGTFRMLEDQTTCKLGTPTQDGSNFSDGIKKKELSSTSKIIEFLMLLVAKMKRLLTFKSGRRMDLKLNLGNLLMQVMLKSKLKV
jgi:hypothetical protein